MKMKESSVSVTSDSGHSQTLRLSGLLSEWLFATGFWSEVNATCGTMFDQYEEDLADTEVLIVIAQKIDQKIQGLRDVTTPTVEFVHGWAVDWTPLKATAKTEAFLGELMTLRNFLQEAVLKQASADLSL
ncbi:hypothetical protein [Paraburkholderia azotifigens]|uniref:Uncharacterized protein n=1 Tax=Paraburkholderia azotifigens TaxID=2057004 RepID=A0A5C6VEZ9_9BURK|nr:hypothetical protein [Paraburkholderia azotifigens]TXC83550.1 hypothetical protein FRZ40_24480 [Paraburkholderia azotifigens]